MKILPIISFVLIFQTVCYGQLPVGLENLIPEAEYELLELMLDPKVNTAKNSASFRNEYVIDSTYTHGFFSSSSIESFARYVYDNYNFRGIFEQEEWFYLDNGIWNPLELVSQTTNDDGFLITSNTARHTSLGYIDDTRKFYTYADDLNDTYTRYELNNLTQNWILEDSSYSTYENGYISQYDFYTTLFSPTGEMSHFQRQVYKRDDNELITTVFNQKYDEFTEEYIDTGGTNYYYDSATLRIDSLLRYRLEGTEEAPWLRSIYYYDGSFLQDIIGEKFNSFTQTWSPNVQIKYIKHPQINLPEFSELYGSYDEIIEDYTFFSNSQYFYSINPLDTKTPTTNDIELIMANPFEGNAELTIKGLDSDQGLSFVVYDISGNKVLENTITNNDNIVFGKHLSAGAYFIQLIQNNEIAISKKVIKIK